MIVTLMRGKLRRRLIDLSTHEQRQLADCIFRWITKDVITSHHRLDHGPSGPFLWDHRDSRMP